MADGGFLNSFEIEWKKGACWLPHPPRLETLDAIQKGETGALNKRTAVIQPTTKDKALTRPNIVPGRLKKQLLFALVKKLWL